MKSFNKLCWMSALCFLGGVILWLATTNFSTITGSDTHRKPEPRKPEPRQEAPLMLQPLITEPGPELMIPEKEGRGTGGYLVYDCSHRHNKSCGGWSDRLTGILCTYVLAKLTNRTFLINFDNPCKLEDYFDFKSYDWRYNKTLLDHEPSQYYDYMNDKVKPLMSLLVRSNSTQPIKALFTKRVSFFRINWDITPEFRKFLHIDEYVPWISTLHFADINRYIYELFLKPKPFLYKAINTVYKTKKADKIFCAHIRMGRSSTFPRDSIVRKTPEEVRIMFDFIEKIDKRSHDLFLATDNIDIQKRFYSQYSGDLILDMPGRLTHIDQAFTGDVCEGFYKQLLDFLFLQTYCDKLVITNSGFSMVAAYLRDIPGGLYCWTPRAVITCSRYTIHDFFPLPLLGPPREYNAHGKITRLG
ncbi:uncharacterized protein LOC117340853 [Pecten maximus]|uniref:uncharacterized protein LOC117340853 n=1 Tax=Pecten maximus TaxID=6579 RepID=UPI0014580788|nr:uncharacterized protein LOC117340853 [Pecten maximus]